MRTRRTSPDREFHGELESSDLTTAQLVPIYDADNVAITSIGANERLCVTQVSVVAKTATDDLEIFQDFSDGSAGGSKAAGELVTFMDAGATSGIQAVMLQRTLRKGVINLKAKSASAVDTKIIINGYIKKG